MVPEKQSYKKHGKIFNVGQTSDHIFIGLYMDIVFAIFVVFQNLLSLFFKNKRGCLYWIK